MINEMGAAGVSGQKWCDNNNVSAGAKGFGRVPRFGFQEAAWDSWWKRCTRCHMPTTVTAAVVLCIKRRHGAIPGLLGSISTWQNV